MDKTQALQSLLDGTAAEEEIDLLRQSLASGEIFIGGNVNHSILVQGSENNVQVFQLTPQTLELLGGHQFLGNLDRDLTRGEIDRGLGQLEVELPLRAPVLLRQFQEQARRLRPTLKTSSKSLSDQSRGEQMEALAQINGLCLEALDLSFNALCLGEEPPEYDSRSPFRGLESFRPEDSEFFFGREELTRKLVRRIKAHPFLAVLGASGSGKSSLVMAGLIPALHLDIKPVIFRPGTNPMEPLKTAGENALIVVDQFEELITSTREEATRKEFIARLLDATKHNKVIITMRSDFLSEVAVYRDLNQEVQNHLENVPPMNMDELRRAVVGQAGAVGLRFEADLSHQILENVAGEPGAMPLLQHALWELWNRRHGRNLRASEYRAFGGVRQAISSAAEKVFGECVRAEQEQIHDIFLRLTRLDESDERRDTRRRVAINDLIPSGQDQSSIVPLLDKLANARLIVKSVNEGKTEIEVAHEALIRHWERLGEWLKQDRDDLRLRDGLSSLTRQWESAGRKDDSLLLGGWRLKGAIAISAKYPLNDAEHRFIALSIAAERRRMFQRVGFLVSILTLLAVFLALGPGRWAYYEYQRRQILRANPPFEFGAGEIIFGTDAPDRSEEEPQLQTVHVDAFKMDVTEATNGQYRICVEAGVCDEPKDTTFYDKADLKQHPVVSVTFDQAAAYCAWLGGRLPTTYEWERAARGQKGRSWPWGESLPTPANANLLIILNSEQQEWFEPGGTFPAASFKTGATPEGIYDLLGNVWEWTTTKMGNAYIQRGGAWDAVMYHITNIRISVGNQPEQSVGFRCAY